MSYIEKLTEYGTGFKVQRGLGSASFAPVNDRFGSSIDPVLVGVDA